MKKRGRPMKGSERLEARLGFRIPQSLHDAVLKRCDYLGMTKSEFIIESLQKNLTKPKTWDEEFASLPQHVQDEIIQKKRIV